MAPPRTLRLGSPACAALLVALSVAYRLPALLNAATVDADAAIVGLQARHILRGELSLFLYGSGYQTSVDSFVAALFFALLGGSALALMLSTLVGHIVATVLAFLTLARRLLPGPALVATLPLVLTSAPLHTYILNPPRQAALTLLFVAVFLADGAPLAATLTRRATLHAAGALVAGLACFADPYALLVLPPLLLFAAAAAFDGTPRSAWRVWLPRVSATLGGAAIGLVPLMLLLRSPGSVHGETTLTAAVVKHNLALLLDPCLPWLLGATAYAPKALLGYLPVDPGPVVHSVERAGAALFVASLTVGGLAAVAPRVAWPERRLAALGFVVAIGTVAAFLVSVMVMDLFSTRYLAALVLFSPFALAPVGSRIGGTRLFVLLLPYLVSAAAAGWLGYGEEVDGPRIVRLSGGGARDERDLVAALRARGVTVAVADYWVSYRLTFLDDETLPVVPIHAKEDRYAPYRDAYRSAARSAYIYDPKRSREDMAAMQKEAFEGVNAWGTRVEEVRVGPLVAVVFEKGGRALP